MGCGHEDFPCCGCGHDEIGHDMSEFEDEALELALPFDDFDDEDEDFDFDDEPGDGMTDVEADADTLRSAGWGSDEDYGYFGDGSDE